VPVREAHTIRVATDTPGPWETRRMGVPSDMVSVRGLVGGVHLIDLGTAGGPEVNGAYLVAAREPALVETGPAADLPRLLGGLDQLGVGPGDLAHVLVSHVHLDHAGAAGHLLRRFPSATIWVHERGAPHLADPGRLVASTARTFGEERMLRLFGLPEPVPSGRIRVVADGEVVQLGDRSLEVMHAPGHASHHIAIRDADAGAVFTGEAIGCHLPWADCYRPALPPPEVDIDAGLASIARIRETDPETLLTSHFGPVPAAEGCERAEKRIRSWAETARGVLEENPEADVDVVAERLRLLAREDFLADAGRIPTEEDAAAYDMLGSVGTNARGLTRYWRKRWEAEGTPERG
jgi:glyoxylase-like metal-dependent hydrolase (beta-lactamase superfamily II)